MSKFENTDQRGLCLVTGGCGFIGSHLVDRLLASGRRVRVLDDLSVGRRGNLQQHARNPLLEIIEGDVGDAEMVALAMRGADRVFHLAARADIVPSIEDPDVYYGANVQGTYNVVQAARANNVNRLVYAASSSCYGIPDQYPTPETAPEAPQYPYALTKMLGEKIVMHWAQVYNLPALSLRFFNVYGPRARTSGTYGAVFGVFLAQLRAGEPLTIVGDGTQTRDFTHVSDAVDAILTGADSDVVGGPFNVGSGVTVSVNRIAELLGAAETINIPKRPGEPDCTFADIAKIKEYLNWTPKVAIEEGVADLLTHIEDWSDAPVWTPDTIASATKGWFRYLGEQE